MIVEPKIRGFICTTAHPEGCRANVQEQINYVKQNGSFSGAKRVLVIGASTGYGLASRISASFGAGAQTIGVFFEKPSNGRKTASAGWYNTVAFEEFAAKENIYAKSINGDAFSNEVKQEVIDLIKNDWDGKVDLVIYSLASPRRTHPETKQTFNSTLKPIGDTYKNKTVDIMTGVVSEVEIEPATEENITDTVNVMGGDDWKLWIEALASEHLLSDNFKTVAYSYIGPELTYPVYRNGTIGRAKEHLENTAKDLNQSLNKINGSAYVSVNKGLVTQASSAIPVVPLYLSILYKVMKKNNVHEGCIEQIHRLFTEHLYSSELLKLDTESRIRIDDLEMRDDIQQEVSEIWKMIDSFNIKDLSDIVGYQEEFYKLFGFNLSSVDYAKDTNIDLKIKSINEICA